MINLRNLISYVTMNLFITTYRKGVTLNEDRQKYLSRIYHNDCHKISLFVGCIHMVCKRKLYWKILPNLLTTSTANMPHQTFMLEHDIGH